VAGDTRRRAGFLGMVALSVSHLRHPPIAGSL
jgi:hypothetical protein